MNENHTIHLADVPIGEKAGSVFKIALQDLSPFDTVLVKTANSVYRILLLDPKRGRALVEGGSYLREPNETLLRGSAIPGAVFEPGTISAGARMEMWVNERVFLTSPVASIEVKHNPSAEPVEDTSETLH